MWVSLWILAAAPMLDLVVLVFSDGLGPNPQEAILRSLGIWSLTFLLFTYSIGLFAKLGVQDIISCRRMLGLWTFFYLCVHLVAYMGFEHNFMIELIINDAISRPFVFTGFLAFFLALPLALTSNNYSLKVLKQSWKKLHSLIHPLIALGIIHFFFHRAGKNDFFEPVVATVVFLAIIGLKIVTRKYPTFSRTSLRLRK
ncbi:MAG: hypothetical protein CBC42_03340 [Betaproteobacteria bacterium TMED82]|nr:MAG: hypothetical protein CBC42_03340 [Betaproteobacteria bacterium TMED82]|tara:strand:+ start:60383 stop:60979 length:597 start_codon:yes stop_codon:yes gene_type:complete